MWGGHLARHIDQYGSVKHFFLISVLSVPLRFVKKIDFDKEFSLNPSVLPYRLGAHVAHPTGVNWIFFYLEVPNLSKLLGQTSSSLLFISDGTGKITKNGAT
ncbi:hypothetical protein GXM_05334 [Nostoc sphaeroides CCNUC1]|uniref:Uncharacterized protein n=1 Tax=Nostoc sphaeroides CCNUC1 TaxID=2653204 RepID=A0A5P8W5F9_9NOSO|nr:hypothetical protein GXM_05334 [Nostoc sphaeroides CCNUC1]